MSRSKIQHVVEILSKLSIPWGIGFVETALFSFLSHLFNFWVVKMLFVTLFSVVHEWSSWSCYWALQTAIAHLIKKTSIKYRPSQVILKCKMSLDWKNILNPVMLISKWWKIICRCSSFYVHVIKRTYHRLINLLNILMLLMNVSISICFWRLTFN